MEKLAIRSNGYPHVFDHARLTYDNDDRARHRLTSGIQNVGHEPEVDTGSGNHFRNCSISGTLA